MTIKYGKGRIFHSTLGHIWRDGTNTNSIMCVGFITTLLRGSEWVATGKVKQKLPEDFPSAETTSLRKF